MPQLPKDKRKFEASFSVRIGTQRVRFELSPAAIHNGPEGLYRVRIDRRWLDTSDGSPRFMDREQLATLVVNAALGDLEVVPPAPEDFRRYTRCSVKLHRKGEDYITQCTVLSAPIRAFDGRYYVFIHAYDPGRCFVPIENIIVRTK